LDALFANGRIVDLIVGLMALEWIALAAWHLHTRRGIAPVDALVSLLAGAFLLLALRAALTAEPWTTVGLWLAGALAAHLVDLARRWRR
jgi:hypothetical protein